MRYQILLRLLCVLSASLLPGLYRADAFSPVNSCTINNVPMQPGYVASPGNNVTTYFQNRAVTTQGGTGVYQGTPYDGVGHFRRVPDGSYIYSGLPPGWQWVIGPVSMWQCLATYGDIGGHNIVHLPGPGSSYANWGTTCTPTGPAYWWEPVYDQALHAVGQPNAPVCPPSPPTFKKPGDEHTCGGDPSDTRTGLYYQMDTDIDVPDVIPIRLTRTYRTEDTGTRAFGIGANHAYAQYMLRDDLCTEARVILPDGAYIAFLRTSGTNCLDATLQHTTTQTAFYAATLGWDTTIMRYRLRFTDGTEWRFSEFGLLVAKLDRNGHAMTLTRAAAGGLAGNLIKITTPNGRYLTFTYDGSNRITQVTDILGRTITYTYDGSGRLWKVTNPLSGVSEYTYDASHRLLTEVPPIVWTGFLRQ